MLVRFLNFKIPEDPGTHIYEVLCKGSKASFCLNPQDFFRTSSTFALLYLKIVAPFSISIPLKSLELFCPVKS